METETATKTVTESNFAETIEDGIVLLDFWAAWCGPCRAFAPTFEAAAEKHPDIVFGKVDTEAELALAGAFRIRSIPTLMVFRDGILLGEYHGMLPASALEQVITQVRGLDMDDIRRRVAEQEAKTKAESEAEPVAAEGGA